MLLYDAKNEPTLGYAGGSDIPAKKLVRMSKNRSFLLNDGLPPPDENAILPVGGKAVLDSQESVATQKTPEAQALIEGLLTDECKVAIRSETLRQYADGLLDLVAIDKKAKLKKLTSFTSQLRAWPAVVQSYWIGTNERDNDAVRKSSIDLQTVAQSKISPDCPYLNDASKLLSQVVEIKDNEVRLFKAQIVNGGGEFPLDEYYCNQESARHMYWFGPVAVRPRVAGIQAAKDPEYGVSYVPFFPIANFLLFYNDGKENNPALHAIAPGYTDYLPYVYYNVEGTTISTKDWNETAPSTSGGCGINALAGGKAGGDVAVAGPNQTMLDDYMAEQVNRMYPEAKVVPYVYLVDQKKIDKIVPKQTTLLWYSIGSFVALGLLLDPEWGGTKSNDVKDKTPAQCWAGLVPSLRKRQDQRRVVLGEGGFLDPKYPKTGTDEEIKAYFENTDARYYILENKVRKLEEAVSTTGLFPAVSMSWLPDQASWSVYNYKVYEIAKSAGLPGY